MIYKSSKAQTKLSVMFRLTTFFHSAIQMSNLAESTWFKDGLMSKKKKKQLRRTRTLTFCMANHNVFKISTTTMTSCICYCAV